MAFITAWRNFKRMQDTTVVAAGLIYAAAVLDAVDHLPGDRSSVLSWTLMWPAAWLGLSMGFPLFAPPLRRRLAKYVWMSFQAGFGQTAGSVILGFMLLAGAGLFIRWQVGLSGLAGVNVFSAFAAGIGILVAQAILVRALERAPEVRSRILEPKV